MWSRRAEKGTTTTQGYGDRPHALSAASVLSRWPNAPLSPASFGGNSSILIESCSFSPFFQGLSPVFWGLTPGGAGSDGLRRPHRTRSLSPARAVRSSTRRSASGMPGVMARTRCEGLAKVTAKNASAAPVSEGIAMGTDPAGKEATLGTGPTGKGATMGTGPIGGVRGARSPSVLGTDPSGGEKRVAKRRRESERLADIRHLNLLSNRQVPSRRTGCGGRRRRKSRRPRRGRRRPPR